MPDQIKFNGIIDQTIVGNFLFAPRLALFTDEHFHGQKIFEAQAYTDEPSITIVNPKLYTPTNLVFNVNPQDIMDSKLIRTDAASLRDAIIALKYPKNK